jgi:hypothetical protein
MTMSTSFDWSRFAVRINVAAPTGVLYNAWATRAGIEHWFLRVSEYKEPGGRLRGPAERVEKGDEYRWLWHGWPDDVVELGTILDCNGADWIRFSFGKAGDCSVTITQEEKETIVELAQENIPTDDQGKQQWHIGCKTGWTFYLANLKSLLEGGIDLRNKNERLKNMINA